MCKDTLAFNTTLGAEVHLRLQSVAAHTQWERVIDTKFRQVQKRAKLIAKILILPHIYYHTTNTQQNRWLE